MIGMNIARETKIRRVSVTDSSSPFTIPIGVIMIMIQNIGATDMRINFSEDGGSHYWTIKAGASLPSPIIVKGGRVISIKTAAGSTTVEVLMWG